MKKTWIKIKRGILDPKHINKLGAAWYLYFYILDQADWETGTIPEWKDEYAALDLKKPIGLIREHRKRLKTEKYIDYEQNQHSQIIIIKNWTDPRRYDGIVQNKDAEGSDFSEPTDSQDSGQGSGQGTLEASKTPTPSYNHNVTIPHTSNNKNNEKEPELDKPKEIKDLMKAYLDPKFQKKEDPAARFPESVRDVVREFIRLWKVEPLQGQMGYWIEGATDVKDVCKEFGVRAIRQAYEDYNARPFHVSSPNSIVKLVQSAAGKLRQHGERKETPICVDCMGTGYILQKGNRRDKDGRVLAERTPCPRCGKENQNV